MEITMIKTSTIPDYNFPVDPAGRGFFMTNLDMQKYEENVKLIRSMVLDNNGYINDLHESNFCVMTTINDQSFTELSSGLSSIPYQTVQNPTGIFTVDDTALISSEKHGNYDISFCLQLTSDVTKAVVKSKFTFSLYDEESALIGTPISVTAARGPKNHYPAIIGSFTNVPIGKIGDKAKKVSIKCRVVDPAGGEIDVGVTGSTLDPYKNFLVVEPTGSKTKAGLNIAKSLRDTLAGLSFRKGHEVRATVDRTNLKTPRTYGEKFNTNVVEAVPPKS